LISGKMEKKGFEKEVREVGGVKEKKEVEEEE
jgi:hypothetical protein